MRWFQVSLVLIAFAWQSSSACVGQDDGPTSITLDRLLPIHLDAARTYSFELEGQSDSKIALRETPLSQWTNSRRNSGQLGHVFVWQQSQEPVAIAAIFSFPWQNDPYQRRVVHEMHALSPIRLDVSRSDEGTLWKPQSPLDRQTLPAVTIPVPTETRFRLAVRQISRRFSGYCLEPSGKRWELRVLPTPLLLYPISRDGQSGFGAILGMMGDLGNDLECGIIVEAIQENSSATSWKFAPIRMTDKETYLLFDKMEVWKNVRSATNTSWRDSDDLYFRFQDKTVPIADPN
ncbi:hypothetical protein LOC67_23640 [Stieleria sp. JC731]|uniref:hypothetical protein n=1 Tax=Pirellulaceae TaxID=2691357 RepID=UPI001E2FA4C2|nr:hypothetical protein [Stieleria sp. JC731]MCC9603553.1 hypothetical protein [Stieleria sp. JC731]